MVCLIHDCTICSKLMKQIRLIFKRGGEVPGSRQAKRLVQRALLRRSIISLHLGAWLGFLMKLPLPQSNDAVCWKARSYAMAAVSAGSR